MSIAIELPITYTPNIQTDNRNAYFSWFLRDGVYELLERANWWVANEDIISQCNNCTVSQSRKAFSRVNNTYMHIHTE